MDRRSRRALLETLKDRPTPWTDAEWREWAAVEAAEIMDRGYARLQRDPVTGNYIMDRAFAIGSRTIVVGPGWKAFEREIGTRASRFIEVV